MKIKPIKHYQSPSFPTQEHFDSNPELLFKSIPLTWRNKAAIVATMSTILLGNVRSSATNDSSSEEVLSVQPDEKMPDNENGRIQPVNEQVKFNSKIAPIFEHGEGRGAFGCIVISPPAVISESEAKQIIIEMCEKYGVQFDTNGAVIEDVKLFFKEYVSVENKAGKTPRFVRVCEYQKDNLRYDGYDKNLNIGFIYVSASDFRRMGPKSCIYRSSVYNITTKRLAKDLRSKLKLNGKSHSVVFYDPLPSLIPWKHKKDYRECMRMSNIDNLDSIKGIEKIMLDDCYKVSNGIEEVEYMRAVSLLRMQVQDFLWWVFNTRINEKK